MRETKLVGLEFEVESSEDGFEPWLRLPDEIDDESLCTREKVLLAFALDDGSGGDVVGFDVEDELALGAEGVVNVKGKKSDILAISPTLASTISSPPRSKNTRRQSRRRNNGNNSQSERIEMIDIDNVDCSIESCQTKKVDNNKMTARKARPMEATTTVYDNFLTICKLT